MTAEVSVSPDEPAADRLGAAARALADAVVRTGVDAERRAAAAEQLEALVAELRTRSVDGHQPQDGPDHAFSLVGGTAHPTGPQLRFERIERGVRGAVTLGPSWEGGPDLAHGGVLALLLDHAMGAAVFAGGYHAMTGTLTLRYRRPTRLGVPLEVTAHVADVDGRKLRVTGAVTIDGEATVEAEAVFLELTEANVRAVFPGR